MDAEGQDRSPKIHIIVVIQNRYQFETEVATGKQIKEKANIPAGFARASPHLGMELRLLIRVERRPGVGQHEGSNPAGVLGGEQRDQVRSERVPDEVGALDPEPVDDRHEVLDGPAERDAVGVTNRGPAGPPLIEVHEAEPVRESIHPGAQVAVTSPGPPWTMITGVPDPTDP
ncbi:MAG TPA: hypothetical protein VF986_03195 [Actinomycetota bacterium]